MVIYEITAKTRTRRRPGLVIGIVHNKNTHRIHTFNMVAGNHIKMKIFSNLPGVEEEI
jgi:hypothetical protein